MLWLAKELQIDPKDPNSWYPLSRDVLIKNRGSGIISHFGYHIPQLLTAAFPDLSFLPWMFSKAPRGFWEGIENQRLYMHWLSGVLNREEGEPRSWYSVNREDLMKHHGAPLLDQYRESLYALFTSLYPDKQWLPWLFSKTPNGFWLKVENQKVYMKWLSGVLKREEGNPEAWYSITREEFLRNHGDYLLSQYKYSVYRLLSSLYPNANFLSWKFTKTPNGFWDDRTNQRTYLKWLSGFLRKEGKEEGDPEAWYSVSFEDFVRHDGYSLINRFGDSPYALLKTVYPDKQWLPWRFSKVPGGYWEKLENQRTYLEWLSSKLGYKKMEDWYQVTAKHFEENFGGSLLTLYKGSPSKILSTVFSDFPFQPWLFGRSPVALGHSSSSMNDILQFLEKELRIRNEEDWQRVTQGQLRELGVFSPVMREGGLHAVLKKQGRLP